MATDVMSLREYGELILELAEDWDGEEPIVLIGDRTGNINVSEKDGFSKHGAVGFAHECFDGNGVFELGQAADTRFYGAMLFRESDLADDIRERMEDGESDE